MAGAKYPETILVKLPEGTKARITESGVSNQNAWVRGLIERALVVRSGDVGIPISRPKALSSPPKPVAAASPKSEPFEGKRPKHVRQISPEALRMRSDIRSQDKAALLELVRGGTYSPLQAERALGLPGLRYRNAEADLMADGSLWTVDGVLETFDE